MIALAGRDAPGVPFADGRVLPLRVDGLTSLSLTTGNGLIRDNIGPLPADGIARATMTIPDLPSATGLRLFAAAFTFDPTTFAISTVCPQAVVLAIR